MFIHNPQQWNYMYPYRNIDSYDELDYERELDDEPELDDEVELDDEAAFHDDVELDDFNLCSNCDNLERARRRCITRVIAQAKSIPQIKTVPCYKPLPTAKIKIACKCKYKRFCTVYKLVRVCYLTPLSPKYNRAIKKCAFLAAKVARSVPANRAPAVFKRRFYRCLRRMGVSQRIIKQITVKFFIKRRCKPWKLISKICPKPKPQPKAQ